MSKKQNPADKVGKQAIHAETGKPFAEVTNGDDEAKN